MTEEEIEAEAIALNDYVFSFTHVGATDEYFSKNEEVTLADRLKVMDKSIFMLTDAAKKANK